MSVFWPTSFVMEPKAANIHTAGAHRKSQETKTEKMCKHSRASSYLGKAETCQNFISRSELRLSGLFDSTTAGLVQDF